MSEHSNCEALVHQLLEVEAHVTITPLIKHGKPIISCVESDIQPCCDSEKEKEEKSETAARKCTFTVTQLICVEIPIAFDVEVDVDQGIATCCTPDFGPCKTPKPPKPHELKEPAKIPNIINFLNLINLKNLRNLVNKDIFRNSLYHIEIFPNIMHYKIRKV